MSLSIKDILGSSEVYANKLNGKSITDVIINIVNICDDDIKQQFNIAPYCYFQERFMDTEVYSEKNKKYTIYLNKKPYKIDHVNLELKTHIKKQLAPVYKRVLPREGRSICNKICGLIGVPIDDSDGEPYGDHYVAYIYNNGILYYFDSASSHIEAPTHNTYILLKHVFNPTKIVCNRKIFEEAGGVDDDEMSYIAQNIFCHTWGFWFIWNMLKNKLSMTSITKLANSNKNNLILIKKFIYVTFIPIANLNILYKLKSFKGFQYILEKGVDGYKIKKIIVD